MSNIIKMDMTLTGVDELKDNLRLLPERMRKPVIKRAMLALAKPMVAGAQNNVEIKTGRTKRKILVSAQLSKRQRRGMKKDPNMITIYVGVGPSRKAHLLEFGTGPRHTKSGHYTGIMPPHPYIEPAFVDNAQAFLNGLGKALGTEIEKTAKRYYKKQAKLNTRLSKG